MRLVERECKLTKYKAAMKLCQNMDSSMTAVQQFEVRAVEKEHTGHEPVSGVPLIVVPVCERP